MIECNCTYLLCGIPYDLPWLLQCRICTNV